MHFTIPALLLATGLVTASPTLSTRGEGTTFSLLFGGNSDAPDEVSELRTGIWALARNADGAATLYKDRSKGALFYEFQHVLGAAVATGNTGLVVPPGEGTATVPAKFAMTLEPGNATRSMYVELNTRKIPVLKHKAGRFQACRAKFLQKPDEHLAEPDDIVLNWRKDGQRRFAECADIPELIAGCTGSGEGSDQVGALGTPVTVQCQPH